MGFNIFGKSKEKSESAQEAKTETKNNVSNTKVSLATNIDTQTKTALSKETKPNIEETPKKTPKLKEALFECMDPKTKEASLEDIKKFLAKKGFEFIDEAEFLKFLEKRRMQYYVKDGFVGFVDFSIVEKSYKEVLAKKDAAQKANQEALKPKVSQKKKQEQEESIKKSGSNQISKFSSFYKPAIIKKLSEEAQKEFWGKNNDILIDYLRYYFSAIQNNKEYVFESEKDAEYICFNTGLLTNFCEDIYGIFKKNSLSEIEKHKIEYVFHSFAKSSEKIMRENFKKRPPYYQFITKKEDIIFDTKLDMTDGLEHILEDNLDRFPKFFQNLKPHMRHDFYTGAKSRTKKMLERDYRIAVPQIYEGKLGFFIPLYLSENLENPDVALAVVKEKESYHIATVLELKQAYINARVVGKVASSWLRLTEN